MISIVSGQGLVQWSFVQLSPWFAHLFAVVGIICFCLYVFISIKSPGAALDRTILIFFITGIFLLALAFWMGGVRPFANIFYYGFYYAVKPLLLLMGVSISAFALTYDLASIKESIKGWYHDEYSIGDGTPKTPNVKAMGDEFSLLRFAYIGFWAGTVFSTLFLIFGYEEIFLQYIYPLRGLVLVGLAIYLLIHAINLVIIIRTANLLIREHSRNAENYKEEAIRKSKEPPTSSWSSRHDPDASQHELWSWEMSQREIVSEIESTRSSIYGYSTIVFLSFLLVFFLFVFS